MTTVYTTRGNALTETEWILEPYLVHAEVFVSLVNAWKYIRYDGT